MSPGQAPDYERSVYRGRRGRSSGCCYARTWWGQSARPVTATRPIVPPASSPSRRTWQSRRADQDRPRRPPPSCRYTISRGERSRRRDPRGRAPSGSSCCCWRSLRKCCLRCSIAHRAPRRCSDDPPGNLGDGGCCDATLPVPVEARRCARANVALAAKCRSHWTRRLADLDRRASASWTRAHRSSNHRPICVDQWNIISTRILYAILRCNWQVDFARNFEIK